jgi:hypothetical protein
MNFAKATCSYAILVFFSIFVYLNTNTLSQGVGYEYLAACAAFFVILLVISGNLSNIVLWRGGSLFLAIFFIYFATHYYFDTDNSFLTRQATLGTTGGIVFSFFMGLIVATALSVIYDLLDSNRTKAVLFLIAIIYLIMVVVLAALTFSSHMNTVVSDRFLIDEVGGYQRAGDLFVMQFLAVAGLACTIISTENKNSFIKIGLLTLLLVTICAIYSLTAQLLGSNKGFVIPIGVLLVFFAVILSTMNKKARRTSLLNILFSGLFFKLLIAGLFGLVALLIFGQSLLNVLGLDFDSFRISGFGTGEVNSVTSRNELFIDNFILHFMYSPIFGHTQVDVLTTGSGTYVHSTLSILTHLGLVGFLIFIGILWSVYNEISRSYLSKYSSIYSSQTYGLFRLLCLLAILVMGAFSAFFTWMPLWFSLGLLGNWYHQFRVKDQLVDNRQSSKRRRRRIPFGAKGR